MNETLASVEQFIEADLNRELSELHAKLDRGEVGHIGFVEDRKALQGEAEKNVYNVREAFRIASNGDIQERVVPDYLIDGITFEIMHDPVVTPSGHSFDRVAILNHLQLSDVDPITRIPMTVENVRPNYALKAACEEFLDKNGWAVDW